MKQCCEGCGKTDVPLGLHAGTLFHQAFHGLLIALCGHCYTEVKLRDLVPELLYRRELPVVLARHLLGAEDPQSPWSDRRDGEWTEFKHASGLVLRISRESKVDDVRAWCAQILKQLAPPAVEAEPVTEEPDMRCTECHVPCAGASGLCEYCWHRLSGLTEGGKLEQAQILAAKEHPELDLDGRIAAAKVRPRYPLGNAWMSPSWEEL